MKLTPVVKFIYIFWAAFVSIFLPQYSCLKNYKAKLWLEKSCAKHFSIKKASIKCWWNWHLTSISSTFFCARFSYEFLAKVTRKSCQNDVCQKFVRKNVDEIDTWLFLTKFVMYPVNRIITPISSRDNSGPIGSLKNQL